MVRNLNQVWGMTDFVAKAEASRCLFCFDAPCRTDCPARIDVPGFIRRITQQNVQGAYQLISRENPLPWISGVLCPTERLCVSHCPRKLMDIAIDIGSLQAYATVEKSHTAMLNPSKTSSKNRVAIVGTGPAGLTAISCLSQDGFEIEVFEAEEYPGGLITFGIPPYKIDKKRALEEIESILNGPGIAVHMKTPVLNPSELLEKHDAVFIATGIGGEKVNGGVSKFKNVYRATEFLKELNRAHLKGQTFKKNLGQNVLIVGGGNTALDAAVSARLLGVSNVTVVYRRTEKEMAAWSHELETARKYGVNFRFLLEPVSFLGDKSRATQVEFRQTQLGKTGPDGRRKVIARGGKRVRISASSVILGTGRERKDGLEWLNGQRVDNTTGRIEGKNIFLGGEVLRGVGLIVQAIADGKQAACEIKRLLHGEGI
jgi:NADPH-dependent glutamate synthase beta subunit-like oxidoreductase